MSRIFSLILALCACTSLSTYSKPLAEITHPQPPISNYTVNQKANPVDKSFVAAINNFSYKTTSKIFANNSKNLNYSPLSLYYALALSASGACGKTQNELLTLLGVSDSNILNQQCSNLYQTLYKNGEICRLKIANSLWLNHELYGNKNALNDEFVKNASKYFNASTYSVDFNESASRESMQKWISDNTNNTIEPNFSLDPKESLAIINTIDFYDQWVNRFDKDKSSQDVFYMSSGNKVSCEYMNRTASGSFFKGEGFTRARLGLKKNAIVFILPDEGISPQTLLSSPEKLQNVFEGGKNAFGEVVWKIPKFNFASQLSLVTTLKSLGNISAFDQTADFSKIANNAAFISNIHQETHIAIDEIGVEASAFTEIRYSGATQPEGRADMILDRPFIYAITASNGLLLFVGVCENPVAK